MEDSTPKNPLEDAAGTSSPRVEVEPTPHSAQDASAAGEAGHAADQTEPAAYADHADSSASSSATAPYSGTASAAHAAPGATAAQHPVPFAPPQPTETVTRTVVKIKTKKIPVFIASLAGMVVGAVLIVALVMTGAFRISGSNVETSSSGSSSSLTQTIEIDAEDTTLAEVVAAKALPSVVSITAVDESSSSSSIGSGVILDTDGNVLTNYHVIEDASAISVLVNGESYEAEVVGSDSSSDLAVICIQGISSDDLTPIEIGDSDDITVGEWVMAIGSPFGNEQSVSTGIVSALYRSTALTGTSGTTIYANMIQTDAAINPGNSGGALVNDNGELIGINSVIESYSGSSSGVGFAIPSNYAVKIAEQIIAGETPSHPYIGVTVTTINAYVARAYNLDASEGAYVVSVMDDGPAADAGIQEGDIVTAVDGEAISSADALIIAAREHEIGDTVTLTVVRDGETLDIDVTLASDADVQSEEQDATAGDSSGSTLDEEDLREYLQDLMSR